jgi:hypothetical protein
MTKEEIKNLIDNNLNARPTDINGSQSDSLEEEEEDI